MFKYQLTAILLLMICLVHAQDESFSWPNGAKAALCLTYDDGLSSHVKTVAPMLDAYNFKGTFYPTLSSPSIYNELNEWKAIAKNGHELGNHTVYHPCRKSDEGMEWVKDYLDLDTYSADQIIGEIELANSFLKALDGKEKRTFAYPCAHFTANGKSYVDSLHTRFSAARGSSELQTKMMQLSAIELYNVPSWAPNQSSAAELIAYIDEVIENETLSSFTFHGVGAEHMRVSISAHEEMLQYLDKNRDKIWVTTFQEATDYLATKRKK